MFLVLGITGIWTSHVSVGKSLEKAQTITVAETPLQQVEARASLDSFEPEKGQVIGLVSLPALSKKLPIIQGTEDDQLKKGVGHYVKSSFPGEDNQVVLSGHRDTVFTHLGDLEKGDTVIVKLPYGSFTYSVDHTKIVKADNQKVIHSTDKEELVLTTCYPFHYVGHAPKRYIVYAYPVEG
ncbi:MAG TPA: class D sortase [Bacillales bacterium]